MSTRDGYDKRRPLALSGHAGFLGEDRIDLFVGQTIVVGRSRACDLSTRRARKFLRRSEEDRRRILGDLSFLKVSRRHARISYLSPGRVEIENLSPNGTFVDGHRVDRLLVESVTDVGIEIRLSDTEVLRLRPVPSAEPAAAENA